MTRLANNHPYRAASVELLLILIVGGVLYGTAPLATLSANATLLIISSIYVLFAGGLRLAGLLRVNHWHESLEECSSCTSELSNESLGKLKPPSANAVSFRQALSFLSFSAAAWVLWKYSQVGTSLEFATVLTGLVLGALGAWAADRAVPGARGYHAFGLTALVSVVVAVLLPLSFASVRPAANLFTDAARPTAQSEAPAGEALKWQPYSPENLARLAQAGTSVFVDFTASWCLTCLVNEKHALAEDSVQETFKRHHVVLMKADWTNSDPVISRALAEFKRAGVPLYVLYNATPAQRGPKLLPQLLTPSIVNKAFED